MWNFEGVLLVYEVMGTYHTLHEATPIALHSGTAFFSRFSKLSSSPRKVASAVKAETTEGIAATRLNI